MDCNAHLMAAGELIYIREMSERTSVPASTLRYYEKLGLITSEREREPSPLQRIDLSPDHLHHACATRGLQP